MNVKNTPASTSNADTTVHREQNSRVKGAGVGLAALIVMSAFALMSAVFTTSLQGPRSCSGAQMPSWRFRRPHFVIAMLVHCRRPGRLRVLPWPIAFKPA